MIVTIGLDEKSREHVSNIDQMTDNIKEKMAHALPIEDFLAYLEAKL